jgi:DNA adenine methylase
MLIPYLGEKSKFASFITPNIPTDISTYVEPFGGMFGVFFSLDFSKFKNVNFIYNEINYLNYNLFDLLRYDIRFIEIIKGIKVDKERYQKSLKEIFTETDRMTFAINWLIVLTCSAPNEIGKDSWRGDTEFEVFKLKWKAYEPHLNKISEILNVDYKEVISKYDSPETFFYLDPPYMGREKYYINHDFDENSHYELSYILNNIKGRFALSYYYFDGIKELYPNCRFESKKTIMGTEWLIMNY